MLDSLICDNIDFDELSYLTTIYRPQTTTTTPTPPLEISTKKFKFTDIGIYLGFPAIPTKFRENVKEK